MYVYIYMCVYVYVCVYVYICIYICACVCVYIYIVLTRIHKRVSTDQQSTFFLWTSSMYKGYKNGKILMGSTMSFVDRGDNVFTFQKTEAKKNEWLLGLSCDPKREFSNLHAISTGETLICYLPTDCLRKFD